MQWNKQNISYQGGERCSDDSMHSNFLEWHSARVCNIIYNHLKMLIPRPKNGEKLCIVLCSVFSTACHLRYDPPRGTALFAKMGESSLKYFNWQLKEFTEEKCMPMDDPVTNEKLKSHHAKNCAVNDLRMRQIGPLKIDLRCGFVDSSNSANSDRSNRSLHMWSLVLGIRDYMCEAVLSNQINNNSGVPPTLS